MKVFNCDKHDFGSTVHDYCPFCKLAKAEKLADVMQSISAYAEDWGAECSPNGIMDMAEDALADYRSKP